MIVTDGTNFTQTNKNGKFSFEIKDDAQFVYIVTPAGYAGDWSEGVPAFFKRDRTFARVGIAIVKNLFHESNLLDDMSRGMGLDAGW